MLEPLLIAHLYPAQVEHRVLHRNLDALPAPAASALVERSKDRRGHMHSRAGIAYLRSRAGRRPVLISGGAHRTAHCLRNGLVGLAIHQGAGTEAFDRGEDDARVDLADALPGEALAVERAGAEVFGQYVSTLDQFDQDALALFRLDIQCDTAFVAIEHREVEAVHARQIA